MDDDSHIELVVPEQLSGKLNFLGSWIRHGELTIHGNTGDFTGYKIGDLASITVNGDVGDFAAVDADNYAHLEVTGDAGHYLAGQAKGSAYISVQGSVGDNCGEEISGEELVIKVGSDAGSEVANGARNGTIKISGRAESVSSNRDPRAVVLVGGQRV